MAEPKIIDDKFEVTAPSWFDTMTAAFKYNNLIGSALSSDIVSEFFNPGDQTAVTDEEIIKSVKDNGFDQYVDKFAWVTNRGQLDAVTRQVRQEAQHRQTLDSSGTGASLFFNMLAGAADLPTLIAGPATGTYMAARGFGPMSQAAGSAITSGLAQTAAQELMLQQIQTTRTWGESIESIGGAVVGGAVLGPVVAKAFGPRSVTKLGEGIHADIRDMSSGRLADAAIRAEDNFVTAMHDAQRELGPKLDVPDYPGMQRRDLSAEPVKLDDVTAGPRVDPLDTPEVRGPAEIDAPTAPKPLDEPTPRKTELPTPEQQERILDAVGRHLTPSEHAIIQEIAAKAGPGVTARMIYESLPAIAAGDFSHARGFLVDAKTIQTLVRIGGGNPALDLSVSPSKVAREFVFNFANIKTMLANGREAPAQVMNIASRVFGEEGSARKGIMEAHREWYRDMVKDGTQFRWRPAKFDTEFGLDKFNELASMARIMGDEAGQHRELGHQLTHPAVQKAVKAYAKFDDWIANEMRRSGLIREQHLTANHFRRVLNADRVQIDANRFIQREKEVSFDHVWGEQTAAARSVFNARKAELDDFVNNRLGKVIDEIDAKFQGADLTGVDKIASEALDVKLGVLERFTPGLQHIRALGVIHRKVAREKAGARNDLEAIVRSRTASIDEKLAAKDRLRGLNGDYERILRDRVAAEDARYQALVQARDEQSTAAMDRWVDKEMAKLEAQIAQKAKASDKALDLIRKTYNKELKKAYKQFDAETDAAARAKVDEWAQNHADGAHRAIVTGETGSGGGGQMTGGNVRGSRLERNIYISDRELLENGWISADMFQAMNKMARQDGMDAVIARKYRRPMTELEQRRAAQNHGEAYWLDGEDKMTVPDLDMSDVKARMRDEYDARYVELSKPEDLLALARQEINDLQNIDDTISLARGTHHSDTAVTKLRQISSSIKAYQFAVFMGKNYLTNIGDAAKLVATHGVVEPANYFALRMKEKFDSAFNDAGFLKDRGRTELREFASAMNAGLEDFNMARIAHSTDIGDVWSNSIKGNGHERFAAYMTEIGSKAFLINFLNDGMKTAALGIAQHRLAKIALGDKAIGALSQADRNWLQYIGVNDTILQGLKGELAKQGKTYSPGKPIRWDVRDMGSTLADELAAALHKDMTTTVVSPDVLSKPNFLRIPLLDLMTQFSTFAIESGMATTNVIGQRLRSGEISAPVAGVVAMTMMAWMTQSLSIYADMDQQRIDRFHRARTENPGFFWYTMVDRSGVFGPLTYLSNLSDDAVGFGFRSMARGIAGDDAKDKYPFSKKKFGQHNGDAWKSLGGPIGRTYSDMGSIIGDVIGSIGSTKHGYVPFTQGDGRINQKTIEKGVNYIPLANAFYIRGLMDQYVYKPIASEFPKGR